MADAESLPPVVRIAAGEFVMGSDEGPPDERPAHRVNVPEFLVGVHEVTQADYARFVKATGHRAPGVHAVPSVVPKDKLDSFRKLATGYAWKNGRPPAGKENHPVVLVTWEDAKAYCDWLAKETGQDVRLPLEAEWEKAARGGLSGARFPWGNDSPAGKANYLPDLKLKESRGTEPVGKYAPNGFGLFDMAGNAWEWVYDRNHPYNANSEPGPGTPRLARGGAWLDDNVDLLTVSHRHEVPEDTYSYSLGFRIAVTPKK